jgi:solute carrier family 25 carnitine/acylcarnitine transporter 20/29
MRLQEVHAWPETPAVRALLAGMASGLGSTLITSPIELVKIRQQMHVHSAPPPAWQVLAAIVRTEGIRQGLYRGAATTALRDLGYGPYFAAYELLNTQLSPGLTPSPSVMALSGALAGVIAWISTFWADVVKTKIQASSHLHRPSPPRSLFWSTAADTYRHGGVKAFYAGIAPTLLRAVPVNAVLFLSYELTKSFLLRQGW